MIILLGKSGSGKDTIRKELVKIGFEPELEYTTRPMRPGEKNDEAYHFIPKWKFFLMKKFGVFVATSDFVVASGDTYHYGIAKKSLKNGKGVLITNPTSFKELIRNKELLKDTFSVYIYTSSFVIKKRLTDRGDDETEITRRMKADREDFRFAPNYVSEVVQNDNVKPPNFVAHRIANLYHDYVAKTK